MTTIRHEFTWPDRVVVGTIGEPGSRSFYLQAREGRRLVSVGLEKQQAAVLAEKIEEILDQLMTNEGNRFSIPSMTPDELVDTDPLEQPVEPEFRTGALSLGWDPAAMQVVIEAYPVVEAEDDDLEPAEPAELLVLRIPVGTARAFAGRTLEIVESGRPLCPLCGTPMDPAGHVCPLPEF